MLCNPLFAVSFCWWFQNNQKLLAGTAAAVSVLVAWQQIITQALVWSMDPAMAAFLANQDLWHNLGSDRGGELKKEEGTPLKKLFFARLLADGRNEDLLWLIRKRYNSATF